MTKRMIYPEKCKNCGNKAPDIEKIGGVYNHQFRLKCSCGNETEWYPTKAKAIRNWNKSNHTEQTEEETDD